MSVKLNEKGTVNQKLVHGKHGKALKIGTVIPKEAEPEKDTETNPEEIWQKFELELKWCLDQLEAQLASKKLNQRQLDETARILKTLTNPKAHLVKKRQLMKMTFGDYRQKMRQEELKFQKDMKKISVSAVNPAKQKGKFIRRSVAQQACVNETTENQPTIEGDIKFSFKKSDNSFKFNFSIDDDDEVH